MISRTSTRIASLGCVNGKDATMACAGSLVCCLLSMATERLVDTGIGAVGAGGGSGFCAREGRAQGSRRVGWHFAVFLNLYVENNDAREDECF